ncbi:MAG: WecB/TagA/CpsF family glycosyltransferase [Candidatus Falkowbacteria bacterium]
MSLINILGININILTKKQALVKIQNFLTGGRQHFIVTPNPEIILEAIGGDEELFYILNSADLSLPDGIGLKLAAWAMGKNLKRITGADLTLKILKMAEEKNYKVAVFNWGGGLSTASEIKNKLEKKFPKLEFYIEDIERDVSFNLTEAVNFAPAIIFCTLGAPYQEKFIFHNLTKLASVKIGMGVGGSFDFLTGRIKRAPKIFRIIGLEWLWRLIKQPWRWRRIYNAVIVFPIKFILWRFGLIK